MDHTTTPQKYHYLLLQTGSLPLMPDGTMDLSREHRCTSLFIWPEGEIPAPDNSILTDPCFTVKGFKDATQKLTRFKLTPQEILRIFVTHSHGDHRPDFPFAHKLLHVKNKALRLLPDISLIPCAGHAPDLHALSFLSTGNERVWVVGDAILDLRWLNVWGYYWPNLYSAEEIVQTWRSVANIFEQADIIIPGHGGQIFVTLPLLQEMISSFPSAKHAEECPDVQKILLRRMNELRIRAENQSC